MSEGLPRDYIPKPMAEYTDEEMRLLLKQTGGIIYNVASTHCSNCVHDCIDEIHGITLIIALTTYKPECNVSFSNYVGIIATRKAIDFVRYHSSYGMRLKPKGHCVEMESINAVFDDDDDEMHSWETQIDPVYAFSIGLEVDEAEAEKKQNQIEIMRTGLLRLKESFPNYHEAVMWEGTMKELAAKRGRSWRTIEHCRQNGMLHLKSYCGNSKPLEEASNKRRKWDRDKYNAIKQKVEARSAEVVEG